MSTQRKALGDWGERVAVQYLQEKSYAILARNWKTRLGELDIVAKDRATIVFIEVKTRTSARYGYAEESVTAQKQRTLRQLAEMFLRAAHQPAAQYRIDVVAIMPTVPGQPPEIRHIVDAVSGI